MSVCQAGALIYEILGGILSLNRIYKMRVASEAMEGGGAGDVGR